MEKIIIVDPLSTGRMYAKAFVSRGIECIAVMSSDSLTEHFMSSMIPDDFIKIYHWKPEILNELKELNPVAIVAGCESAIYLAEFLADELGLSGNPVSTSLIRRKKNEMQYALRDNGISYIRSILVKNIKDVDKICEELSQTKKYVIKPINSAGTEGVLMLNGRDEVKRALYSSAWNNINVVGEMNEGYVIQDFMVGPEYVVDMVAFGDTYVIASVCKYTKIKLNECDFVYKDLKTLEPSNDDLQEIIKYAKLAAKALKIKVGPIHMEIINTEQGPVMVEAGARLHGGVGPYLFNHTYEPNLVDLSVDSYLGKESKIENDMVKLNTIGKVCFFYCSKEIEFKMPNKEIIAELNSIPEYKGHNYFVGDGEKVCPTTGVATIPGLFWLCAENEETLDKREKEIRDLLWNYE
ncbi:MAG: ATP-grasp domain-containing protein [Lachnospiraceae bacterium]|nr:ATP-grasp domain-containing protein [Lachnospiraceae bacterium]